MGKKSGGMCSVSFRVNPELKEAFCEFCENNGLTAGRAIMLFAEQLAGSGKVPFPLYGGFQYPVTEGMKTVCFHIGEKAVETRAGLSAVAEQNDVTASFLVRAFMDYCVSNNRFPDGFDGSAVRKRRKE